MGLLHFGRAEKSILYLSQLEGGSQIGQGSGRSRVRQLKGSLEAEQRREFIKRIAREHLAGAQRRGCLLWGSGCAPFLKREGEEV